MLPTKAKNAHPLGSKIPLVLWLQDLQAESQLETRKLEGKTFEELKRDDLPTNENEALIMFLLYFSNLKPSERISFACKELADIEIVILFSLALGHTDLVSYFKNQEPDEFNIIFNHYKENFFDFAFSSGNLDIVLWLKEEFPADFNDNIATNALRGTCLSGNLELVKWIKDQVSVEAFTEMVQKNDYQVFGTAALSGNLELLKWFKDQAPTQLTVMIKANGYLAFNNAAISGNLSLLKWFKKHAPDEISTMIPRHYIRDLKSAVLGGNLEMLQWYYEQIPEGTIYVTRQFYEPLIDAFKIGDVEIINWFLSKSAYFEYAEQHTQEYGEQVNSFIQKVLFEFHEISDDTLPNEVFNIEELEQTILCFYIVRHLIRRNDRTQDDELRFLLNIPSVQAMAHLSSNQGPSNALLRLAMASNNTIASGLLLNIEAVRLEAERNNFYAQENRNGIDLGRLAQDRESSMTALTTGEAKKLESAILHYQPILKNVGSSFVMLALRVELIMHYAINPASIIDSKGETITLPLQYEDLQALNLNETDYKNALIAYYKHDTHTAWRYLSKPNPWMHRQAAYVNVDNEDRTRRWSTFEDYSPLIALFYLAATDKKTEATEGHTLDTRRNHFIKGLALIGRAHNWDRTRVRNGRWEEFDDLQADRPSCYSGVKRRLFQSVIGHPLFDVLDEIKIENEIRQFAAWHFETILTQENKEQVKKIIDECYGLEGGTFNTEHIDELRCFDIPEEKQAEFISYLTQKFGAQFSEDKQCTSQVHDALFLNPKDEDLYKRYHVLKLFNLTNFYDFLDKSYQVNNEKETLEISEKSTTNRKNSVGFFQNNPQDNQPKEQDEKKNQLGNGPSIM